MTKRWIGLALLFVLVAGLAAGCDDKAVSKFDALACVYDGSKEGGQRLKFQIPPGGHSKGIDGNDKVVYIPTSNRFYMANEDRGVADPGAPDHYIGFAQGNVKVYVQGQVRFRFNTSRACEWYAKHGRRNASGGDLGFNSRGDANTGWARWLNENFGVTMKDVISSQTNTYDWPGLVFNYPSNANPSTGQLAKGAKAGDPLRLRYGRDLGAAFTSRLQDNLGGQYFCGIDASETGGGEECPPMVFQVTDVTTADPTLTEDRAKVERLNQQLANLEAEAASRAKNTKTAIYSERQKARLLRIQAQTAILQARVDNAKCIVLASHGLDCEGHRPDLVLGGGR